ncbi:MAG: Glu-tRNA(Gln) amidotransferase subunit GatD [Candidatus Helarchaeota archaeon]|nr:Glu-tRNA(Gln) amidotransferase subunit GatD [Candidatus Helarchaeota archaeon]
MLKNYSKNLQKKFKELGINQGDKIKLIYEKETFEGILIPQSELGDPDCIVLKIKSGYNVGIRFKKDMKIEKLPETWELEHFAIKKIEQKKDLQNITILHTGGTIASRLDYRTGGVVSAFTPEELLTLFPELEHIVNFKARLIANMWSEDIRLEHYQLMAREIAKEVKKGVDGIILGHGTDTLHFTAAALSFMLQDLPVPLLLVGAQRSSDRGSSDAGVNLISASKFITQSDFAGVAICMHGSPEDKIVFINPAGKTRKMHTSRRDAFRPINILPWARIDYIKDKIEFLRNDYGKKDKKRKLKLMDKLERKVGLVKFYTDFDPDILKFFLDNDYKGLILEGTGLGHTPGYIKDEFTQIHSKIFEYLENLIEKNCIIVMTSQCLYGRINMSVYDKGRDLQRIGVIPGEDMLPEVALIKLKWLLGNYDYSKAKELINKNLVGEISDRTQIQEYLY